MLMHPNGSLFSTSESFLDLKAKLMGQVAGKGHPSIRWAHFHENRVFNT